MVKLLDPALEYLNTENLRLKKAIDEYRCGFCNPELHIETARNEMVKRIEL